MRGAPRGPITLAGPPLARARRRPLRGRFLSRPNRFVAEVRLGDGAVVAVHLANPGRLTGTVAPGREVLLDGPFPPPRRLRYTMIAAREPGAWVGTDTTYANRVFPELLRQGLFPELGRGALAAEVPRGRSRFDFQIGARLVEIKSATLHARAYRDGAEGARLALFPDAVTARGARHCAELGHLAGRGGATAIVFLAQRGDVDAIAPADEVDPAFGAALRRAARAGVLVLGCALELAPGGARAARRIPVDLGPHGAELGGGQARAAGRARP
jgi:sugar fermentation stimulation protein A